MTHLIYKINFILGLDGLNNIEDLWMNDCSLSDWKQIEVLRSVSTLRTVYFERNPLYKDTMYRKKIMMTLPQDRICIHDFILSPWFSDLT